MPSRETSFWCRRCRESFRAPTAENRDFLGFPRAACPRCRAVIVLPLTAGYRITYWVLIPVMSLLVIYSVVGDDPYRSIGPLLLLGGAITALHRDFRHRRLLSRRDVRRR